MGYPQKNAHLNYIFIFLKLNQAVKGDIKQITAQQLMKEISEGLSTHWNNPDKETD